MIFKNLQVNTPLFWMGNLFLLLSIILAVFIPYNDTVVLGINSLIKPLKFALSIWIYSWTMAIIVELISDRKLINRYVTLAIVTMIYEQAVITIQAFRGRLSHFNQSTPLEGILYAFMGIFIMSLTLYTLYLAIRFYRQSDKLHKLIKEGVFLGLFIFVVSSLIGGIMSALNTHTIGGSMMEEGIKFVNWSTNFGDLRIAHFIGIHALQIIPLLALILYKYKKAELTSVKILRVSSFLYLALVLLTMTLALLGKSPFTFV